MAMESLLYYQKMGDDLLRSVWFYFGMPFEYIQEIRKNDKPFDKEFIFFVSKAVVIDILEYRGVHGMLFENIFDRCTRLNKDGLRELDVVIGPLISNEDPCSAFIRFCAILCDFILFLRYKGNFLQIDRQRLLLYLSEYYDGYYEEQIKNLGGMKVLSNAARIKAIKYPYSVLKKFTLKYCNPNAPYNKENIPVLFATELRNKYQHLQSTSRAE